MGKAPVREAAVLGLVSFVLIAACGSVRPADLDAGPVDAMTDSGVGPVDASVDAPDEVVDAPLPPPGQDLAAAAGQVRGPTFVLDVELGPPLAPRAIQGATFALEADIAIKP